MKRARRQRLRGLQKPARRALIALRLWLVVIGATCTGFAQADILSARFADETTRYPHGVLGDTTEFGSLVLTIDTSETVKYTLPADRVF
ncbi:MAG: VCBS repeat-containing protein, partial [Pseudomonadota bacterium]